MQVLKKKKTSEGFQNIIYSIWFTTYMFVLQKKSVLLKADTFKKYSVNNKQRNNAFVYWPWNKLCKESRGKEPQKPNMNFLCLMLVDGKTAAKEYTA